MRVKFITLGCKVNQYETQGLKEKFLSLGCTVSPDKADLYVINTCSVTHRADVKSKEAILRAKKENPAAQIAVTGCLAELNRDFIVKLGVDYIVSQSKKHQLADVVLDLPVTDSKDIWSLKISKSLKHRAFVKIQDGCDNFCSFCKIPFLRGSPRSRKPKEVIAEVKRLSEKHKEVVICGVNLGMYGRDLSLNYNLSDLMEDVLGIASLGRVRLSSLEPLFVDKRLFRLLRNKKFCPHFHFPFQYGDDKILSLMNKKERVELYESLVDAARKVNPNVAISCDIMVGLPGETKETFQNTVNFLKRVKPMRMHIFTFSPRDKTSFSTFKTKDHREVRKRYNCLKSLADDFAHQYKSKFLKKRLNMVGEERTNGFVSGYTENYLKVGINEKVNLGEIIPVKIEKISSDRVLASLIS